MYPTSQYMDPYYSHYRNHTPYSYYPPGWEAGHPRAMDSSCRPPSYGPWPYNAGMHHPHPPEYHCCCNHSYPHGYYGFRPPFPQELPPPHLYYHGPFPQHPNEFPPYFAHPHPYPAEQTQYDFNKSKNHCCGCPNHVCHGEEKSNVKIKEERPDGKPEREFKGADNSSIIRHPNKQYPAIWLPSGNIEDNDNGKLYELPPQLLNGWVPVGGKRAEDAKQQGQHDQKEKQFQWPIVWMPAGYDEPKQKAKDLKEMDENSKITEETPPSPKIKIIPLSWFEDQKPAAQSGSRDHGDRSTLESQPTTTEYRDGRLVEGHRKTTPDMPRRVNDERKPARENYKTIPVLPDKETDEKKVTTYRTIPVMTEKETEEKKPAVSENKEEKKSSSSEKKGEHGKGNHSESPTAKHSKLPPVCLRVDPLPRKKSGNGSSRSPSPPIRKDANKDEDMNEAQSQNLEPKQSDKKKQITVSEAKEKSVNEKSPDDMKKDMGFSNETVPAASAKHSPEEENDDQKVQDSSTRVHAQENAGANIVGGGTQENAGAEILKEDDKSTDRDDIIRSETLKNDSKPFRTNLSEAAAAVRIQSAYRGYDVRRWQPLDKLRKIRDVIEQMQGVRKQLQSLEASSKKPTEKEQMAAGEAIMNLLLKLDTIQGLHPSVRDARKSVARELICLQEKLDSLCKQPFSEFNHENEDEISERADSIIHTAAPTLTSEASDKMSQEEKADELREAKESSSVDSIELCDAVPSEVSMELGQDAYSSELKNQKEESCSNTMEVPREEETAAEQVEFQGASSIDTMTATALPEHPADNHECRIEEPNAGLLEVTEEKKIAIADEGQEAPLVDSMEPSHDAASTVDSSGLEKCMASSGQNLHADELNKEVSPAISGEIKPTLATESLDNRLTADNDGSVDDQMKEAVGVERPELKHDVSPAEETPDINLEDPLVSLKHTELHERDLTTAAGSFTSNVDGQLEEARDTNMQEQEADSTQDATKESPEATMDDMEAVASGEPAQAVLVEPTLESDSAPEQTVLKESSNSMQIELSGQDDSPHVDQNNEVGKLTGGEIDALESNNRLAEEAYDTRAETVFPELDSCELSCAHVDATSGYQRPEMKVSLESQAAEEESVCSHSLCADAQVSEMDERTEMPKAPAGVMGADYPEEVDERVSEMEECNGTPNGSPVCTAGVTSAEEEADNLKEVAKEDVAVQIESKASEEALPAAVTPDALKNALKDGDEKKLAEENQKLKEMLQKLLASGNDQMGVITDLSEKVKVLERKLARKKKPKVRVHRPSRHAMAKVH
ncbi:hypothetical protein EJB05_25134 [Eragrostis curvula]|uniref:BAG domain-containing protein n=1 Tax=Eragrostis curvula TaxID=38414 RepID=A0A5J9VD04_9POAL|nr:hypothetical protein EJB05_25134 [Eragrostis curvula]